MKKPQVHNPVEYANLSEVLNANWTLHVTHLNLTPADDLGKEIIWEESGDAMDTYSDKYGHHTDALMLIWNVVLTFAILKLWHTHRNVLAAAAIPLRTADARDASCNKFL